MNEPLVQLTGLLVAAVAGTWVAARLKLPSIVILLAIGILAGPVLGIADPDRLFGPVLPAAVSLAVGLILFEGGLSLRLREVEGRKRVIALLVSVGVLVTWLVGTTAALAFTDLEVGPAILLGSILVVSGPTVIGPLLQVVRPTRVVASILKWEGIFIDPVGAMVAVITFDTLLVGATGEAVVDVFLFLLVGCVVGGVVAVPAIVALRRHWVPEQVMSLFGVSAAVLAFAAADMLVPESGLLATIVLGLVLANHRRIRTEPIVRFSEVLRVLLVGLLFIVLSARLTRAELSLVGMGTLGLIAALVLVGRPLAVALSTWGSNLSRNERILLAGVAPRGIVAASIASLFALELEEAGIPGMEPLAPVTFTVIVATVLLYGLAAGPLARRLGLAERRQEGVLILGAGPVERMIGSALHEAGIKVVMATINRRDEYRARMDGLETFYGNILNEDLHLEMELSGIGRLLALTPNNEVNTLAAQRFVDVFGGSEVFQVAPGEAPPGVEGGAADLGGRVLFDEALDYETLRGLLGRGAEMRQSTLTEEFGREAFEREHGPAALVAFVVRDGRLLVSTPDRPALPRAQAGDTLIWFRVPKEAALAQE